MQIFRSVEEIRHALKTIKPQNKIGFVPTMGALHEGHLSLIQTAKAENDLVVCSIFVNPIQFNQESDLDNYPRTETTDLLLLEQKGCDIVFLPDVQTVYNQRPKIKLVFEGLDDTMEGEHRKGHFSGVGVIVSKLFNIIQPDRAYFGQKDLQQLTIIRQLVKDLSFDVQVVSCPIVREKNGLAMSSRNKLLTETQKAVASHLFKALQQAQTNFQDGKNAHMVKELAINYFKNYPSIRLEYIEIVLANSLQSLQEHPPKGTKIAICLAAFLGKVRLIDNIVFIL